MKMRSTTITAAQRIRREACMQCLPLSQLEAIIKSNPVAQWPQFNLTFHVRQVIDWQDGTRPSVSFIATLHGHLTTYDLAKSILVLEDAEKIEINALPNINARYKNSLLIEISNKVNGLKGWLNCETGTLEVGDKWPKELPAATAGAMGSGVAA